MTSDWKNYKIRFARYAGESMTYPDKGDRVLITSGEYIGDVFDVIEIRGHAFHPVYRVYVKGPEEETLWYWPWNIEIVEKQKR